MFSKIPGAGRPGVSFVDSWTQLSTVHRNTLARRSSSQLRSHFQHDVDGFVNGSPERMSRGCVLFVEPI